MDTRQSEHIELLTTDARASHARAITKGFDELFADHAARGMLKSGATIKRAIQIISEISMSTLEQLGIDVAKVCSDPEAADMIRTAESDLLTFCEMKFPKAVELATRGGKNHSAEQAAQKLFDEFRDELSRKAALIAFQFNAEGTVLPTDFTPQGPTVPPPKAASYVGKTGRPTAEFWDAMWAAIATQLYEGVLNPKRQSDIESAMADWIAMHGHDAAASTIRARARKLWDALNSDG
jgi:hypothetical protein